MDASLDLSFFYKIRDTRELVNGFARSQEFINWIKEIAKGMSTVSKLMFVRRNVAIRVEGIALVYCEKSCSGS